MKELKNLILVQSPKTKLNSEKQTQHLDMTKGPKLRSRKIQYPLSCFQQQSIMIDEKEQVQNNSKLAQIQIYKASLKLEEKNAKHGSIESVEQESQNYVQVVIDKIYQENQEELQQSSNYKTPIKRKQRQTKVVSLQQIFFCQQYKKVFQIDFMIYIKMLAKGKMYSTMFTNQYGQVLYADRLASQHFQGSLNNLSRNPIYSMILQSKQKEVFQKFSKMNRQDPLTTKLLIYSKNSKRRYSKAPNELVMTNQDIFHRYLKCLSCQIIPIQVKISNYEEYEGFWNFELFQKALPLKCYLFKTRLSKNMPLLDNLNLNQDKKIIKFAKYTQKKKAQKQNSLNERNQLSSLQGSCRLSNIDERKDIDSSLLMNSKDIFQQMNDPKHTRISSKKDFRLNSGGGKKLFFKKITDKGTFKYKKDEPK